MPLATTASHSFRKWFFISEPIPRDTLITPLVPFSKRMIYHFTPSIDDKYVYCGYVFLTKAKTLKKLKKITKYRVQWIPKVFIPELTLRTGIDFKSWKTTEFDIETFLSNTLYPNEMVEYFLSHFNFTKDKPPPYRRYLTDEEEESSHQ